MDPASKPAGPREALLAQTETLGRLAEQVSRLTEVAVNKNAEVASSVDAAQAAIKGEREALAKSSAAYDKAEKGVSIASKRLEAAAERLDTHANSAAKEAATLAGIVGHARSQKAQRAALALAFAAGLALPVAASFVPGLRDYAAAWMLHQGSRAQAGVTLIYDQAPGPGQAVANYLQKSGVQ
jgi:hypothetical protein